VPICPPPVQLAKWPRSRAERRGDLAALRGLISPARTVCRCGARPGVLRGALATPVVSAEYAALMRACAQSDHDDQAADMSPSGNPVSWAAVRG